MIRLGLIGCGEHSEGGHAVPLARYKSEHAGEIELAAACDLRVERTELFCRKYGFARGYGDADEMLEREKLDGCIAVVPVERIFEVGSKLLSRGVACEVEKPLGASIAEAKALVEAARATGTPNMVSVNRRFMPFLNRAMEWSRAGGGLRYVRCVMTRHARTEPEFLWATAVHAVDAMRHIAGNIAEARIETLKTVDRSAEWYGIDLRFESGVIGRIDVLPTAGVVEETYELTGEGFRAIVTSPFGPQRGWRGFRENRVVIEEIASENTAEDVLHGFYDEAAALIRGLRNKEPLRPTIEEVFPSVELCLKLVEMAGHEAGGVASVKF